MNFIYFIQIKLPTRPISFLIHGIEIKAVTWLDFLWYFFIINSIVRTFLWLKFRLKSNSVILAVQFWNFRPNERISFLFIRMVRTSIVVALVLLFIISAFSIVYLAFIQHEKHAKPIFEWSNYTRNLQCDEVKRDKESARPFPKIENSLKYNLFH